MKFLSGTNRLRKPAHIILYAIINSSYKAGLSPSNVTNIDIAEYSIPNCMW